MLTRRYNWNPAEEGLSLINRLGDTYDHFCRECGWITDHLLICFSLVVREHFLYVQSSDQHAKSAFPGCFVLHSHVAHLGWMTVPPTLCKSFSIALSYPSIV